MCWHFIKLSTCNEALATSSLKSAQLVNESKWYLLSVKIEVKGLVKLLFFFALMSEFLLISLSTFGAVSTLRGAGKGGCGRPTGIAYYLRALMMISTLVGSHRILAIASVITIDYDFLGFTPLGCSSSPLLFPIANTRQITFRLIYNHNYNQTWQPVLLGATERSSTNLLKR